MKRSSGLFFFIFAAAVAATTGAAQAQATRTWVSGVGDDANPCSRTAPCKTWSGAISKTSAGGEIDALDPGGFGAVTITKAITIDGGGGVVASALVTGTNAIVVAAGATDNVILRNIAMNGIGGGGLSGLVINSGLSVTVQHCDIFGFGQYGIVSQQTAQSVINIVNSTIQDNAQGGVKVTNTGAFTRLTMDGSSILDSFASGAAGLTIGQNTYANVSNSTISANVGWGVLATGSGAVGYLENSRVTLNGLAGNTSTGGIHATMNGSVGLANSSVTLNSFYGLVSDTAGTIVSLNNNLISGNGSNGAPNSTVAPAFLAR